jgi:Transposase domain (DUF772)
VLRHFTARQYASRGSPGQEHSADHLGAAWRPSAEGLSDRHAADAVRSRIDWKYALSLELTDPGFNFSVLSEFRVRLIAGSLEHRLQEAMLTYFKARGWLMARGQQRTDSTHVLARFGAAAGKWRIASGTYRVALGKSADGLVLTAEAPLTSTDVREVSAIALGGSLGAIIICTKNESPTTGFNGGPARYDCELGINNAGPGAMNVGRRHCLEAMIVGLKGCSSASRPLN